MRTEILCVGTEILLGDIINTNVSDISKLCAKSGLDVFYHAVVGDNEDRILKVVGEGLNRSDCLIITGGLGPTNDDITKKVVSKALGLELVYDKEIEAMLLKIFEGIEMAPSNFNQAYKPEGAIILSNPNGTACGFFIIKDKKIVVMLPGPPNECLPMFENYALPLLAPFCDLGLYTKTAKLLNVSEADADFILRDILATQSDPTLAPYAKFSEVHLRVTTRAKSQEEADEKMQDMINVLSEKFGDNIYTFDTKTQLEDEIYRLLKENNYTISTAESCTGGLLAGKLVNVSGISSYFNGGYIVYSNEEKIRELNIAETTLEKFGAVSEETAREMCENLKLKMGCDIAVSITGIAGPQSDNTCKPVGLVYIGCKTPKTTIVKKFHFSGDRTEIRNKSVKLAMIIIRNAILEKTINHPIYKFEANISTNDK